MNAHFRTLTMDVNQTRAAFEAAQRRLDDARRGCQHAWDNPQGNYTPLRTEGYRTQSLMGHFTRNQDGSINAPWVDVAPTETPKWTRTCTICGLVETTDQATTHTQVTKVPVFGR